MHHYVSPFDERARGSDPLAPRRVGLAGARVALLDIRKNRGDEFLDCIETHLRDRGARPFRIAKEMFSKPAASEVLHDIQQRADLVIEALAD